MQIVIRKPLLIAILSLLLVTFTLTVVLAGWVWRHLGAELALRDQIAQVAITQALPIDVQLQDGRLLTVLDPDHPETPEAVVWTMNRRQVKPVMVRVGRHGMEVDGEGCLPRLFGRLVMSSDWACRRPGIL